MTLLKTIERNPEVRRIFGKREIKIIEKQLMGVNLKPSEKTRLSRDIRKKLDIIRELAKFENEFKLKKAAYIKEVIDKTKDMILKHPLSAKIKKIIVFGSAAENELRLDSDIDIAVEFDDIKKEEAHKFRINILGEVDSKVDIQIYNLLPDKIKKEIDKKGKTIHEKY